MMMDRFFTKSMCRQLMALALLSLICMSDGHLIKKRHDGSVVSNGNESNPQPEIDEASETDAEGIHSGIEVTNNGNDNNDVNNTPEIKVTSTTDVNNGIEQNFTGNTNSTNQTVNETIASINGTNQTVTNLQKANFTKEISQDDSVENKLPSKLSDKSEPVAKPIARIAAVSLKDDENKEIQSTRTQPSNPSEKPKRLDTTFARSTERTVAAGIEVSTVPVSQSTASILSTIVQSPKIAATEKIPSRISSISMPEMTEKRAKFLSEKLETSSPSTAHNPDASWSNLKTVGEVHHNNVTLGIKSVNGKLDSEEVAESSHSSESAAAQKDGEEHETQLQKSNSSQISDVSDDNSLSSLQSSSSSHRPTNSVTPKIKTTEFDESKQAVDKEQPTEIPKTKVTDVMQTTKVTELKEEHPKIVDGSTAAGISSTPSGVSPSVLNSTERSKAEESTERVTENVTEPATEKDVYTTTEEDEPTTTIEVETVMPNDTTTLSHIPTVKTKENLVVETTTATAMIPTTETTDVPTTIYVSSPKEDENKVHHEYIENVVPVQPTESIQSNQSFSINSNTTPMVEIESTTPEITKVFVHPTKPITTKANSTEINQKVINDGKVREPIFSSTSTTERSVTTTVLPVNESTDAPLLQTTTFVSVQPKSPPETDTVTPESLPPEHTEGVAQGEIGEPADVNAMIAIGISLVAVITLILLVGFLLVMRKRQKQLTYGQRCRPIGLDAYSLDNISVYNSVRRKSAMRTSKRAFGNAGFDDPGLKNNPLSISQLATFSQKRVSINEEFKDIPTVTARIEEVPVGCEDKNRYANVVPLPESRVHLKQVDDDEKTEYINANFVKGPKDTTHYYIACQAPLEHTVIDFWRMIWEQNSRVIIMATDLTENGIEKCAEYLPSSFVIDNHVTFGDYQITLKNREVRDKYAMSTVHLKNECTKTWREITHFWYQWPENGVPIDEASVIAMLLEARSYLKMVTPEQSDKSGQAESDLDNKIGNGNADKTKSLQRVQGPLTVHCSPGTGRTGTIIACDIAIRSLEQPARNVDVPQIVYFVRRGRASAVQTREQYEFIYKVAHVYATKLTGPVNDN